MHERRRGDIHGPERGDFTDWDNPEDEEWREDAPEGYYPPEADPREDEGDDDSYVPGPDDPDYDLSEAAGYTSWQESHRDTPLPRLLIIAVCLLLIFAILVPVLIQLD